MGKTLKELAELVQGEVQGDPTISIESVKTFDDASPDSIVFILEKKNLKNGLASSAKAVVAAIGSQVKNKPAIFVKNPRSALAKVLKLFEKPAKLAREVHPTAIIGRTTIIGKNVAVGAYTVIGENCQIGDNTTIYPQVYIGENVEIGKNSLIRARASIYENSIIGHNVILHSGVAIGVDGFGFVPQKNGLEKIPQIGKVVIEDDVEIYANTCIARGAIGTTRIGKGTKIDNLTHIAHNCNIGENCAITALVGFAGSVTFKNGVQVGGQAGFSGHITVGENTIVMAKAGVTKNMPDNSIISGFPAQEHDKELKMQAELKKLLKKNK